MMTDEVDEVDDRISERLNQAPLQVGTTPGWMSLAMALAAERELRTEKQPVRASLMRLMEDTEEGADQDGEVDMVCWVCMTRRKGAAFIPYGQGVCEASLGSQGNLSAL